MALQAAATLMPAKFAAGQQLKSPSYHLSKAFGFEAPAAARLTCSLRSDVKDLAQKCADAAKLAGFALATSALLAAVDFSSSSHSRFTCRMSKDVVLVVAIRDECKFSRNTSWEKGNTAMPKGPYMRMF